MIVDSSVLVAIIRKEPGFEAFLDVLDHEPQLRLSAAGYLEVGIVIDAIRDPGQSRALDDLIAASGIVIEPVTEEHAHRP